VAGPVDASAAAAFCDGCGRQVAECAGCRWEYDPPHFCATCGVRMAVNVSPNGWRARCKQHGERTSA
jgi:hypothetical protein